MKSMIRKYEKPRTLSRNDGMNDWQGSAGLWWLGWTLDLELVGRDGWGWVGAGFVEPKGGGAEDPLFRPARGSFDYRNGVRPR
jgi:hypothetical protein